MNAHEDHDAECTEHDEHKQALDNVRDSLMDIWYEIPYALAYALVPVLTKLRDEGNGTPMSMFPEDFDPANASPDEYLIASEIAREEWKATLTTMIEGFQAHLDQDDSPEFDDEAHKATLAKRDAGLLGFAKHYGALWD